MGMKDLKPAANGRYATYELWAQIVTLLFAFTVQKYIYPHVSKVHAGSFRVSVIHRDMDYRIFNVRMFLCMHMHTGMEHTDNESAQHFDSEKVSQIVLVLRTGFEPLSMASIGS